MKNIKLVNNNKYFRLNLTRNDAILRQFLCDFSNVTLNYSQLLNIRTDKYASNSNLLQINK